MNTKYLVLLSAMAIMLIGATALATEDAFATEKKHYGKSQTTSQVNDCGNDILPENVGCQNTDRQLQGDNNSCTSNSLTASQVFPDERSDEETGYTWIQPGIDRISQILPCRQRLRCSVRRKTAAQGHPEIPGRPAGGRDPEYEYQGRRCAGGRPG